VDGGGASAQPSVGAIRRSDPHHYDLTLRSGIAAGKGQRTRREGRADRKNRVWIDKTLERDFEASPREGNAASATSAAKHNVEYHPREQ